MDVLRGSRILAYTVGTVAILAGIVLLAWPDRTIIVVARLAGILIAIVGVAEIIEALTHRERGSYWGMLLVRGVLNLAIGVVLLVWPDITVTALVWLFGLDLVVTGVIGLIVSGRVPKEYGRTSLIVRCVAAIVFGIMIVAWPDVTLWIVTLIIAAQLLIIGAVLIWSGYELGKFEDQPGPGLAA
jgi:uncharacterized membrane protein HdeD (DUF308 family)